MTQLNSSSENRSGSDRRDEEGTDMNYFGLEKRGVKDRREENNRQFATFYIAGRLYGIDVMQVQEITKALPMTRVPLAPNHIRGLINLRGQIATAVSLRDLFKIQDETPEEHMNVVCRVDGLLLSLLVDRIGDVMEVAQNRYEPSPETIPDDIRKFMDGVYKIKGPLLSIIDMDRISSAFQSRKEKS